VTTAKASRFVLERLASGSTVLLAILLDQGAAPTFASSQPVMGDPRGSASIGADPVSWAACYDALGRAIYLVGAHALRQLPQGDEAIAAVLASMATGEVPEGVLAIAYKPAASAAIVEVVFGGHRWVLIDGPRGSGKSQAVPAAMAMLAEEHARAGFPLPLRMLWLHSTLVAARERTVPALQQAQWGGLWSFENDQQVAVLRVGGQDYVRAAFVPTQDVSAQDRARGESHGVIAEEVVGRSTRRRGALRNGCGTSRTARCGCRRARRWRRR
jgi:hypothetical protein